MYVTVLMGYVSRENWSTLQKAFAEAVRHPPKDLLHSVLVQSVDDPMQWQIISFWSSYEAYQAAEANNQTDTCIQLFCAAGSTPTRRGYRVSHRFSRI